jgi:cell wall-associated NlpC family hydrolase
VLPSQPMKPWATLLLAAVSAGMTCVTAFAAPDTTRLPDAARNNTATQATNALAMPPSPQLGQQQDAIQHYIATKAGQLKTAGEAVTKTASTVADKTSDIVLSAMGFLGVPYHRGGTSFETGFDCSGFVHALFEQTLGLALPRAAKEQAQATQVIAKSDLQPGDLVFFNTMRRAFSHVGIYIGDNKFIHSPRSGAEIRIEDMGISYWQRRFNGARRVDLPPETTVAALPTTSPANGAQTATNALSVASKDAAAQPTSLNNSTTLTLIAPSPPVTAPVAAPLKNGVAVMSSPASADNTLTPKGVDTPAPQLKPSKGLASSSR